MLDSKNQNARVKSESGAMINVFQPIGKNHIQYIHRMAERLWKQNYGCKHDDFDQAIKDALETHRTYLITGIKMTKAELNNRRTKRAMGVCNQIPTTNKGIWWRNETSGNWEQLLT
jgi:hypothetical protein